MTITYAAPAAQATTTVTVSGNDITVTPGTKAKMQINNVQVVHSVLGYAGQVNGYPMYSSDGSTSTTPRTNTTILYSTGSSWVLISWYDTLNAVFSRWSTSGPDATPDLITSWLPEGAGSGTPTIAPISSSASQVIAAVAANPTAAALISGTLASSNDGTGAVTAMATLHFPILERKFVTTWKTDNPGKTSSTQITIPTNPGINPNTGSKFVYNYKVEWGDGTSDMGVTGDKVHTYATAGTYTVSISGTFPSFQFKDFNSWADRKNESDSMKLLTVEEWGTNAWQSFENAFQSCENLEIKATDAPNLTAVKSMKYMFTGATKFNQPIGHWNVSNVVNMEGLFQNANTFNQDLSGWERTTPGNVSTI